MKRIQGGWTFKYWVDEKKRIGDDQVSMIDWDNQGKAMGLCRIPRRHWVSFCCRGGVQHRRQRELENNE